MCCDMQTLKRMILFFYTVAVGMAAIAQRHFVTDDRFAGEVATSVDIQWSCTSTICCSLYCLLDSRCESFFFDGSTCYGLTTRMITIRPVTSLLQARYFENKGVLGINLAAGKPSSQNGLYAGHGSQGNYTADKANDGSRESEPNGAIGSCSHLGYTSTAKTMWWYVDLQAVYRVTAIALLARKDALPSEFENIKASVGMMLNGPFTDCVADTGSGFYGEMRAYVCIVPIVGQYVKISKYCTGWTFTLCEVEVYGDYVV